MNMSNLTLKSHITNLTACDITSCLDERATVVPAEVLEDLLHLVLAFLRVVLQHVLEGRDLLRYQGERRRGRRRGGEIGRFDRRKGEAFDHVLPSHRVANDGHAELVAEPLLVREEALEGVQDLEEHALGHEHLLRRQLLGPFAGEPRVDLDDVLLEVLESQRVDGREDVGEGDVMRERDLQVISQVESDAGEDDLGHGLDFPGLRTGDELLPVIVAVRGVDRELDIVAVRPRRLGGVQIDPAQTALAANETLVAHRLGHGDLAIDTHIQGRGHLGGRCRLRSPQPPEHRPHNVVLQGVSALGARGRLEQLLHPLEYDRGVVLFGRGGGRADGGRARDGRVGHDERLDVGLELPQILQLLQLLDPLVDFANEAFVVEPEDPVVGKCQAFGDDPLDVVAQASQERDVLVRELGQLVALFPDRLVHALRDYALLVVLLPHGQLRKGQRFPHDAVPKGKSQAWRRRSWGRMRMNRGRRWRSRRMTL